MHLFLPALAVLALLSCAGCQDTMMSPTGADGAADAAAGTDGSPPADAMAPADAATGRRFACGATTCAADSEFCYQIVAGARAPRGGDPHPEDADGGVSRGCNPIPAMCLPAPTCSCIQPTVQGCPSRSLFCRTDGGGITITCALP